MSNKPPSNSSGDDSLFEFPCSFPIKAIGKAIGRDGGANANSDFEALVVGIVLRHAPDLKQGSVTTRPGSKGNYLAVTVTIEAGSRAQLDAIYHELSAHPDVIMAL